MAKSKRKKSTKKSSYLPIVVLNNNGQQSKPKRRKTIKRKSNLFSESVNPYPNKDTVVYIQNYPPNEPVKHQPLDLEGIQWRTGGGSLGGSGSMVRPSYIGTNHDPVVASSSGGHSGGCCGGGGGGLEELSLLEGLIFLGALWAAVYFLNAQIIKFLGGRKKRVDQEQPNLSQILSWGK